MTLSERLIRVLDAPARTGDLARDEALGVLAEIAAVQAAVTVRALAATVDRSAPDAPEILLTMKEVATRLAMNEAHVRELGRRKELPVIHVGRSVRISEKALKHWLNRQT